jgi:uncharacterized protein (DUF1810 family)
VTLFAEAAAKSDSQSNADNQVFSDAILKYFAGKGDQATLARL